MTEFGKVAVLLGGQSAEREISLKSGNAVLSALLDNGVDATAIDVDSQVCEKLQGYDRAFIVLHGRGGEDGKIQGLLETLGIPYTGTGVTGSALGMDKLLTKQIWKANGLPTPDYAIITSESHCRNVMETMGYPVMLKPVLEGSSIGISRVEQADQVASAWQAASVCHSQVIAEAFVQGEEYTAAILGDRVLPMIKLETPREFYDYEAKYSANDTRYICPCGLAQEREDELAALVLDAFRAVHAQGWGRVDFMLDDAGHPWLIEVNTVPGMTDHSLVPMAAKQAGMSFNQLVLEILKGTL